jgi:HprK-related kinase A
MTQSKSTIKAGRFTVEVRSSVQAVLDGIGLNYQAAEPGFSDFHIEIKSQRLIRPQSVFSFNTMQPFSPLPLAHAYPLLEWGLNWCVTQHCHHYLIIHSAVVEKNGKVIIMPGAPGSGKSTLCAALVAVGGWRLLSDELALIGLDDGMVFSNPRPVSLKNRSIDIIQNFAPSMGFTPRVKDTIKGTVAHMGVPAENTFGCDLKGSPAYIIFPKFIDDISTSITRVSNGNAFIRMAENSFNYNVLRERGFNSLSLLMKQVECFDYHYAGNLTQAIETFDQLVEK